ncbi:MAG: MarR family transcriptional regulator [Alphaproteobacteria bacterium]|nr:MAG: MarR family transcriptional regulator [Alphaproteobacteria bacterium]
MKAVSSGAEADIASLIGPVFGDVSRLFRRRFDRAAQPLGLTRAQWLCLGRLARFPGVTQRELAELMDVAPITLSRIVTRLERDGLIARHADPADRRVWRLYLTPEAEPLILKLFALARQLEDEILAVLTPAERAQLKDMLHRIASRLAGRAGDAGNRTEGSRT